MGRWFGYRGGYADLTRIHTTSDLSSWFHDLATVEHQLREDIAVYERQPGIAPRDLGLRILRHPAMLVTSPLKQRHARTLTVAQCYAGDVVQTFKFPFTRPGDLAAQADANLALTREFLKIAGAPTTRIEEGPIWTGAQSVDGASVVAFLRRFALDETERNVSLSLICAYIERQLEKGELVRWTVAVKGRKKADAKLGEADWGVADGNIAQIERTRLRSTPNSIGVVTDTDDEEAGLSPSQLEQSRELARKAGIGINVATRQVRPKEEGLLLLYPISRHSGHKLPPDSKTRQALYADTGAPQAKDLIAFALSFPSSESATTIFAEAPRHEYLVGTVDWRPVE